MVVEINVAEVLLRERVRITAVARMVLRDSSSADDIYQQVVLIALQTQRNFENAEHAVAWAMRAARHQALNAVRDRKTVTLDEDVLDKLQLELSRVPSEVLRSRADSLSECIEELPPHSQRLLRLRYVDGLRCQLIAEQLHRSLDCVYQNLSRLHRLLKSCVDKRTFNFNGGEQ